MARTEKRGLEYLPLDLSFFEDRKIRRLQRKCDADAPMVYIALLCTIYREGYYIKWDEDLMFDLSEMMHKDEQYVTDVVNACLECGLLSDSMYDRHRILTSQGIQKQYNLISEKSKRKGRVSEYSLLSGCESERCDEPEDNEEEEEQEKTEDMDRIAVSDQVGEESLTEDEKQAEKFLYYLTFHQNIPEPGKELEKIIAYNSGPQVKKKWVDMTEDERKSILVLWKQQPQQLRRFGQAFLVVWQRMFDSIAEAAPYHIRMAALSDNVKYEDTTGVFYLSVPSVLRYYMEENMDKIKSILWPFVRSRGCTKLLYKGINEK